jgi:hypothetical protein
MADSSASVSFAPPGPKNFTPLSAAGLWEAVMTAPSAAPRARVAPETAGVGAIPAENGRPPAPATPAPSARARAGPDARVSRPISTLPERTPPDSSHWAAAAPRRPKNSSLTTGPP